MRAKHITSKTTLTRWFLLLLAVPLIASSCSKDSDIVTANDYCYIKSVTLGTVKRKTATVNTTFSGSSYAMTINLRDNTIENRDSLPFGSQLSRVTANIIFDGLMLTYRTKGSNAEWTAYNSADSLDLTAPLELKLTSNDNNSSRIYTFKVNVHKQEGDSLYWNMCESEVPQLADMTDMKAFILGGKLMVLGQKTAGIVLAERSSTESQGTWEETPITDLPTTADLQTLREQGETLLNRCQDMAASRHNTPRTLNTRRKDSGLPLCHLRRQDATLCRRNNLGRREPRHKAGLPSQYKHQSADHRTGKWEPENHNGGT